MAPQQLANIQCLLSFSFIKKLYTGKGCVEMDIPWQSCWTIGPLMLHSQDVLHYRKIKKHEIVMFHASGRLAYLNDFH